MQHLLPKFYLGSYIFLILVYLPFSGTIAQIGVENVKCICSEGTSGAIEIIVQGTAGPFTFSWEGPSGIPSDMQNLENITVAGTYTVTVTNAYMCETVLTTQIGTCDGIDNLIFDTGNSCPNTSTGFINLTVSGGTEPFSFNWNTGEMTQNLNNLSPGEYCVTVQDGNGCEFSDCITISNGENIIITPLISNNCEGEDSGSIDLLVQGGMEPYGFSWDTGGITPNISGLSSGEYCVTITDNSGCSLSDCFTINQISSPNIFSMTTNNCGEGASGTGVIQISVSGGLPPFVYAWSNGSVEEDQQDLTGGTYNLTVTDENGCSAIESFVIEDLNPPSISAEIELATCLESANGQITLAIASDALPYDIFWSNGQNTDVISNLTAGEYCVTIIDVNGCSTTECFQTTPTEPQEVLPFVQKVEVFAVAPFVGGELIYSAEWVPVSAGCFIYSGGMEVISQALMDDIAIGNRKIEILAKSNIPLALLTIELPGFSFSSPPLSIPEDELNWRLTIEQVDAINLVSNNTIDQMLKFSGNDFANPPNELVDMRTASNNMENCVDIPKLQIEDCIWSPLPDPIWNDFDDIHLLDRGCLEIIVIDINPEIGEIKVNAEHGLEPYDFFWQGENGFFALGKIITGVPPGEYCVTVKDANGCTEELCIELCPPLQELITQISVIEPVCNDLTGGAICIDDDGKYALKVLWSDGSNDLCIDELLGATYCVTITELLCNQTIELLF